MLTAVDKRKVLPGVLTSFFWFFVVRKHIILKEIHFSFIQNIGHLILHTLPIFQVSYEYLARKTVFGLRKKKVEPFSLFFEIAEVLLCKCISH